MNFTPEIIDGVVLQLRAALTHSDNVPPKVKSTGDEFLNALDAWSESLKNKEGMVRSA